MSDDTERRRKAKNKAGRKAKAAARKPGKRKAKTNRPRNKTATEMGLVSPDGYMSPQAFARHFDVSEMSVYRLIGRDEVPHVTIGRLKRLPKNAIEWYERRNMRGRKEILVPKGTNDREAAAAAHAEAGGVPA